MTRPGDTLISVEAAGATSTWGFLISAEARKAVAAYAGFRPPTSVVLVTLARDPDEDEELARAYVSRLWADDWDSGDDSVYDTW